LTDLVADGDGRMLVALVAAIDDERGRLDVGCCGWACIPI
jgi:hypothetical protein